MFKIFIILFLSAFITTKAQIRNFPDVNFKAALIAQGVDKNNDFEIDLLEAENVTELILSNKSIKDFSGMGVFPNLEILYCKGNLATTIDLSNNKKLYKLDVSASKLLKLSLVNNTLLKYLDFGGTGITSINLENNYLLDSLMCNNVQNTNVTFFDTLDLNKNLNLSYLECSGNVLTKLSVAECTKLNYISCDYNKLSVLDLEKCYNLESFTCSFNALKFLNINPCTKLRYLNCGNNPLSTLIMDKCINLVSVSLAYTKLKEIKMESFEMLKILNVSNNTLSVFDVSKNYNLEELNCNQIGDFPNLEFSKNVLLKTLYCYGNWLSKLDISMLKDLEILSFCQNNFSTIDVTQNYKLKSLVCSFSTKKVTVCINETQKSDTIAWQLTSKPYLIWNTSCVTGIEDYSILNSNKRVVNIYNSLGQFVKPNDSYNQFLIYEYEDGSKVKRVSIY